MNYTFEQKIYEFQLSQVTHFMVSWSALSDMSALKYIHRLQHIGHLIWRYATGKPDTFAREVGLWRNYLHELRETGAPISHCKRRESYFY